MNIKAIFGIAVAAIGITAATRQEETYPKISDVTQVLAGAGYRYDAASNPTLGRDGLQAWIRVQELAGSDNQVYVNSIDLVNRYQLDQPLDSIALNEHPDDVMPSGVIYTNYLDHTLLARKHIQLVPGYSRDRLLREVQSYWLELKHLETVLPKNGWKSVEPGADVDAPLDENAVVDRANGEDFGFLVKKWGLWGPGPSAGNSMTWWQSPMIEGHIVYIRGVLEGSRVNPYKISLSYFSLKPHPSKVIHTEPNINVTGMVPQHTSINQAYVQVTIDLSRGIKVRDLKKRILDFAHKAIEMDNAGRL